MARGWREDGGGDVSGLFSGFERDSTSVEGDGASIDLKCAELFVDVAEGVEAGDGFLAQVATFIEADRLTGAACFLSDVGICDVNAVERESGFDTE